MAVNTNLSACNAVAVSVGAVALGQSTVEGHVTVREPVASCNCIKIKLLPATGVGNVYTQLPVSVMICTVPFAKSSVMAVELLPVNTSSV